MKYDEASKIAAPSRKKGPAESKEQEIKDLNKMPGDEKQMNTPARKKGSAKEDPKKIATKIAKGKAKAEAKKGAVQKDVMMDENMSGGGRKKGSAKHIDGKDHGTGDHKEGHKGSGKKKGSADYSFDKGSHDHPHGGAGRMGFTQNFGPARQNSYARGAAKVAKIMGYKGAGDAQGGKPHKHPMDQGSINSMRSQMGDIEGTVGGGGYSNRENYDSFNKTSKTFPKGVIQDYSNLGGAINPAIAKDELQTSLNRTKSGVGGSGTDSYAPFTENAANPSSRAYYSPSNGVQGIDPQTNKSVLYGGQQSNSNKVQAFSSAFQGNMRETIKLRKEGVKAKGLNSKGVVANTELKAPILGASKKPHAKKKKY